MVGGKIIEVNLDTRGLRLWCMDRNGDELAIYVKPEKEIPCPGDDVWWQGRTAYWSTKNRTYVDRNLDRIGYSFDPHKHTGLPVAA